MADCDLTAARLQELLNYNADSGIFTRLKTTSTRVKVGGVAGGVGSGGYTNIKIDGILFLAHRLAWLYTHNRWPKEQLDHINGKTTDNRLLNLREASHSENQQNCKIRKDSGSGFTGVSFNKTAKKWQAQIAFNKKLTYLGIFDTPELASFAYQKAKLLNHKFQPTIPLRRKQ